VRRARGNREQVSWGRTARIRRRREGGGEKDCRECEKRRRPGRTGGDRSGGGGGWAWRGGGRGADWVGTCRYCTGTANRERGLGGEERDELANKPAARRLYAPLHSSGVYPVLLVLKNNNYYRYVTNQTLLI